MYEFKSYEVFPVDEIIQTIENISCSNTFMLTYCFLQKQFLPQYTKKYIAYCETVIDINCLYFLKQHTNKHVVIFNKYFIFDATNYDIIKICNYVYLFDDINLTLFRLST